jgi:hypothetical protein
MCITEYGSWFLLDSKTLTVQMEMYKVQCIKQQVTFTHMVSFDTTSPLLHTQIKVGLHHGSFQFGTFLLTHMKFVQHHSKDQQP